MTSVSKRRVAVLVPCYGDGARLGEVIRDLRQVFAEREVVVYVVDDGSVNPLALQSDGGTTSFRLRVLRHIINLGQGAALETARRAAVADGAQVVLTVDADGQHSAADALRLVEAIESGADVAVGNRFGGQSNTPSLRAIILACARIFEMLLTRRLFGDAHNGLRAFSFEVASRLRIEHARMAHGTGIMLALCRMRPTLRIVEVPVTITYTAATLAKGQRASGAFTIVGDLLAHALFRPASK